MKKIFLVLIFIPLLLSAHIQDEDLFKTARVPAASIILLDRSGSMVNATGTFDHSVTLRQVQLWEGSSTNLSGWYDSTLIPNGNMDNLNGDPGGGVWILRVQWREMGRRPLRGSRLTVSWILRIRDGSGWHEYDGGSNDWSESSSGLYTEMVTLEVTDALSDIVDAQCYINIATYDGLEVENVGLTLTHTPGTWMGSNRIKDALLVIHSLLDVNSDGLVDENDEFPIKLGMGFFDSSMVFVGDNKEKPYNADSNEIRADNPDTYNNPIRWDQVSKTWVDDLTGTQYLRTDSIGTSVDSIWKHVNSTEVDGSTPNGMLVDSAVKYIAAYRNAHPELWCMKFSVVLVTDGKPNVPRTTCHHTDCDDPGHCEYTYDQDVLYGAQDLVNVAYNAFYGDNDTISGPDSIRVYAVGFGTSILQDCANTLNWTARWGGTWSDSSLMSGNDMAVNGSIECCSGVDPRANSLTGYAYIAEDAEALSSALVSIFTGIEAQRARSFTSAEVTSIEEEFLATGYEARMYLASFYPDSSPFWEGHLQAVRLVEGGLSLDTIPDSLKIWDAGKLLRSRNPSTRSIYGIKSGSIQEFNSSNFDSTDLAVSSSTEVDTVVNLVKCGKPFLDTLSYLGDIFHSSPLRVSSPSYWYRDDDFDQYRDNMSTRTPVIYAGSNTGMLHAFYDETGEELFAVIPENFVPEVKALADSHRFYVDADPMAADVWFPEEPADSFKDADEWKTVLMVSQGEGGRGITCLNVTDPSTLPPNHLFSIYDTAAMGYTTSVPVIFKVGMEVGTDTLDRFFAFFGGGEWPESMYDIYSPGSEVRGNVIVALDIYGVYTSSLAPGTNFWHIPAVTEDVGKMIYPFASAASVVNLNSRWDNLYDLLYIPDLAGQLWKVDLTDPNISNWRARCIFQPPIPVDSTEDSLWQPAFYAPLVEREPATGCLWLFYGTGDRAKVFKENADNRFYAILDTLTDTMNYPLKEEDLKRVWTEGPFDFPSEFPDYKGWYIVYSDSSTHTDEKTVSQASLFLDTLKFVTFEPTELAGDCNMGSGGAREYSCHFRTGSGRFKNMGGGIPQAPRYSFDQSGSGYEIHQTSDSLWVEQVTGFGTLKRILQWKER